MTERELLVGPFNRVEGDLELRLEISGDRVQAAYANSPLFRGFEMMLLGKAPQDALTLTPRICGICSISQSAAAARALAAAQGVSPTENGARATQIIHAVENLADHITHFALFFMPDFARPDYAGRVWHGTVTERFLATKGSMAHATLSARAELMHILGLLAGKWPHTLAIQPGGVTKAPTARDKARIALSLAGFRRFLERDLFGAPVEAFAGLGSVSDLLDWDDGDAGLFLRIARDLGLGEMGTGPGRYLSFGAYAGAAGPAFAQGVWDGALRPFDPAEVVEDLSHAWMLGEDAHPEAGQTRPDEDMAAPAYSWCKAPRLAGQVAETGAFARQVVDGHPLARALVSAGGSTVLSRVAGRLLEVARTQLLLEEWTRTLQPEAAFMLQGETPRDGEGVGLVEAARGALGHWLRIERGKIAGYQIIAPTTWNFSPRDRLGQPGAVEAALAGAPVGPGEETPIAVQHIVRSFDPCMVCTVH
ncbi:nickel-dependent hydrogenase large subunit [Dinoroseobacter sp. S375]|uniref:nickel-dependent hydrogenase large subunit n=1 Tax=Dinoroseobacter sp. S375 TaxID=3415136 RepID=UPI003C7D5ADB